MRRLFSIAILLLLALPLVAPALGQTAQQHLLLCCRKGGSHHCTGTTPTDAPTLRAQCPAAPNTAAPGHAGSFSACAPAATVAPTAIASLPIRQVEAGFRISHHRSRHKRGPPATLLS